MKVITSSASETQELAKKLAQKYRHGAIIALSGPLGSGKTTFTQGFAQGLGIKDKLISPTFIIMRQYDLPEKTSGKLFHIDLYRLETGIQMTELGLSEIFANPENIILIEWAEKSGQQLPAKTVKINFRPLGQAQRQIEITD